MRTARAKGVSELGLFKHILPNGLIPILTGVVVVIPSLFMGSLVMESLLVFQAWAAIPSTPSKHRIFAIVRSMVFLGSVLYIFGLILTDISYTLVDPRGAFIMSFCRQTLYFIKRWADFLLWF